MVPGPTSNTLTRTTATELKKVPCLSSATFKKASERVLGGLPSRPGRGLDRPALEAEEGPREKQ